MRLSPIVRRLLKPFLARISRFTRIGSTFATVNMSAALLSAVFLFSLPAAAAEEEEEEPEIEIPAAPGLFIPTLDIPAAPGLDIPAAPSVEIPEEYKPVFNDFSPVDPKVNANKMGNEWVSEFFEKNNDNGITLPQNGGNTIRVDATRGADESQQGHLYFSWSEGKHGTFESSITTDVPSYSGDVFDITYQVDFTDGNVNETYKWDWEKNSRGKNFAILSTANGDISVPTSSSSAPIYYNDNFSHENIIGGVYHGLKTGKEYASNKNNDRATRADSDEVETGAGSGGSVIFLGSSSQLGEVNADFINNGIESTKATRGGVVYVGYNAGIKNLKGNFIGNYIKSNDSKAFGGVILNWGTIDTIDGNFIGNHIVNGVNNGVNNKNNPVGGVIANGSESCDLRSGYFSTDRYNSIEHIRGIYIGNYLRNDYGDVIGAVIANYGHIGDIDGVFIGNYAYSQKTANSGVFRNYSRNATATAHYDNANGDEVYVTIPDNRLAVIGATAAEVKAAKDADDLAKAAGTYTEETSELRKIMSKAVIKGVFIGNYAQGVEGDGYGGVTRNNGSINGAIEGLFIGNYATTEGKKVETSMTSSNTNENVGYGNYDYFKSGAVKIANRQNRGMAYGGAIFNELKADSGDSENNDTVALGDIVSVFIDNYVHSTYGEGFGGAVYNQDASIEYIKSNFQGNYAESTYFIARGGAVFNNANTRETSITNIGVDGNEAIFNANFAQGKMAQGGAIFVASLAEVENVHANFTGNYVKSAVKEDEGQYYFNIRNAADTSLGSLDGDNKLRPTAQGGALYVADGGEVGSLNGLFGDNHAVTTGVGTLTVEVTEKDGKKTETYIEGRESGKSANEKEIAQGGAIYVAGLVGSMRSEKDWNTITYTKKENNIGSITASFIGNDVKNTGDNDKKFTGISAIAQGGAIYVNTGIVGEIEGSFGWNAAYGETTNSEKEEVQGGAIYVSAGGEIGEITSKSYEWNTDQGEQSIDGFYLNTVEAKGQGSLLTEQKAQGGAIYVSSGNVLRFDPDENSKEEGAVTPAKTSDGKNVYEAQRGQIGNITADFVGNSITATLDGTSKQVRNREVQGGAIYLYNEAKIGKVDGIEHGFYGNTITVEGGSPENEQSSPTDKAFKGLELLAQGGAIYVANKAHAGNIVANFIQNGVTSTSTGNTIEKTGGGAIYVAEEGYIGSIGHLQEEDDVPTKFVDIAYNYVNAGGNGDQLIEQRARGGAILVSQKGEADYSVRNITADIYGNSVILNASVTENSELKDRYALGGAIYVSNRGVIRTITGKEVGFSGNTITVNGGYSGSSIDLRAWGGALYVEADAKIDNVEAAFTYNRISTGTIYKRDDEGNVTNEVLYAGADGNMKESLAGGAIYVAGGGRLQNIGADGKNVSIMGNELYAGGNGANLKEQEVQGGAIFVGASKLEGNTGTSFGTVEDIYAEDIAWNKITANFGEKGGDSISAKENDVTRVAQGGAIYVAEESVIRSITATGSRGISGNTITVEGGNNSWAPKQNLAETESDLVVQGGAIYVNARGHIGDIKASAISGNSVTSKAEGNTKEYAGGGAIYVADEGYIGNIGHKEEGSSAIIGNKDIVAKIQGNQIIAEGMSSNMFEQRARGGAILVSQKGEQGHSIGNVTADFIGNSITANVLGDSKELNQRYALGGAIYLSKDGVIGDIYGSEEYGFYGNTIAVSGGESSQEGITLNAWGGAMYVADDANANKVVANFIGNMIVTGKYENEDFGIKNVGASGNVTESVAGGALYVAGGGSVGTLKDGQITGDGIGTKDRSVRIQQNELHAGGMGAKLEDQEVQGGAIFVGMDKTTEGNTNVGHLGSIHATTISWNKIFAESEDKPELASKDVQTRVAQGGAIYVADEATIGDINVEEGIFANSITVTGGNNANKLADKQDAEGNDLVKNGEIVSDTYSDLVVQGGAIYVNQGGHLGNIVAPKIGGNSVTSEAVGNQREYVGGGAIYVNAEGYVGTIGGADEKNVGIIYANEVVAGGLSKNLEEQRGRGGAILMSQRGAGVDGYSSKGIYADFVGNRILVDAGAGVGANLKDRYALGGAIYLSKKGRIAGDIVGGEYGFAGNTITVNGGVSAGNVTLRAWGGALYVEDSAVIAGNIKASFTDNRISTGEVKIYESDGNGGVTEKVLYGADGNVDESLAGGALFVAGGATVGNIGDKAEAEHVSITGNTLYAGGNGINLESQEVQGGAIFVGRTKLANTDGKEYGEVGNIYATDIAENKITAKLGEKDGSLSTVQNGVARAAQGGAIYVAAGSVIGNITATGYGISGNEIMVEGGNNNWKQKDLDAAESDLVVQGGAIYVNEGGNIGNIEASYIRFNRAISEAVGNTKEYVGGGAIYINAEGYVGDIDANTVYYNEVIARGKSARLTEQRVRGGAILVSSKNKDHDSMGDINADFLTNLITADLEGNAQNLASRIARGGAIYVDDHGVIGNITAVADGFTGNVIEVTGGVDGKVNRTLNIDGGALYLNDGAQAGDIDANFIYNAIRSQNENGTKKAGGNTEELMHGGAIYLAAGASIGDIGKADNVGVDIYGNSITASGQGAGLTTQEMQGGAIYVSSKPDAGDHSIGNIYANVVKNTITVYAGDSKKLTARTVQGGAIYVDDEGVIENIGQEDKESVWVSNNTITVEGGASDKGSELTAQGGAVYLASKAAAKSFYAGFEENVIDTTAATNNLTETLSGGAIYVAGGAKISGSIGNETYRVVIRRNSLNAGGNGENLTKQEAQGGAIYVGQDPTNMDSGSIDSIYAAVDHNSIIANANSKATSLAVRIAQGGAIYLADGGHLGKIYPGTDNAGFNNNYIKVNDGADAGSADLTAQGGALYVSSSAGADGIMAGFFKNYVDTSNAKGNKRETLGGGAIYLEDGATISGIGTENVRVTIEDNYLKAGGQGKNLENQTALGGAIYLAATSGGDREPVEEEKGDTIANAPKKKLTIGDIYADVKNNSISADVKGGDNLGDRTLRGGAFYVAGGGKVGNIAMDKEGFTSNYINVTGESQSKAVKLNVQGGAIYLADGGSIGDIEANFMKNAIVSSATGNSKAELQGGAIYVAGEANVGAITGITGKGFNENMILVGSVSVKDNGKDEKTIEVGAITGTPSDTLTAQGGAIYVAEKGSIGDIDANFTKNKIESRATGNKGVLAQGGAIYVSDGASIASIGLSVASDPKATLSISDNSVLIGEKAVNSGSNGATAQKHAQGGAIYLASKEVKIDDETTKLETGSIGKINADFKNNKVEIVNASNLGSVETQTNVEVLAQGGAIYVSKGAEIASITGDFENNKAISSGKTHGSSKEWAHGGAIDVADSGKVLGNIEGDFKRNGVENSGRVAKDTDGNDMHAKGGAIYLADHGSVQRIGRQGVLFEENYAKGSGQVRAGAVFVSDATVNEIQGTFLRNYADGTDVLRTFGGAMRFDQSTIVRLDSNFIQNWTTGTGGGLSLTSGGVIYEVTGDFLGNTSYVNGGGVDALGQIGQRGWMATEEEGERPNDEFTNISRDGNGKPILERDSTDTKNPGYTNKLGEHEYDGSFTGGFVNSNFLYNTVYADKAKVANKDNIYFHGAGIYTDKDLFITVNNYSEVIMSGNKVVLDGENHRSAIYVDNKNYKANAGDYKSIVVYLVSRDNGVLRIDDNILGHPDSDTGLVLRMRGYADEKHWLGTIKKEEYRDTSGLIILNNRVERTNTIMDDVTLYIGYKPRTYISEEYFNNIFDGKTYGKVDTETHAKGGLVLTPEDAYIGDEDQEHILMNGVRTKYLDEVGTVTAWAAGNTDASKKPGKRSEFDYIHQSDIFRDSSLTVRSGSVALTEHTYATKTSENGDEEPRFTDMNSNGKSDDEYFKKYGNGVYTEYLFGNLTAYGVDYNYGLYGTADKDVSNMYLGADEDGNIPQYAGKSDLFTKEVDENGHVRYEPIVDKGRYATFEFNMGFGTNDVFELELKHKYYYKDMNGNATENSFWTDMAGNTHQYELYRRKGDNPEYDKDGDPVHVKRRMGSSDMLTVFAVMGEDGLDWSRTSKGRITLNGLTVQTSTLGHPTDPALDDSNGEGKNGWDHTNQAVSGAQTDKHFEEDADGKYKDKDGVLVGDGFNRDLYVQLINYMLVDEKGNLISADNEKNASKLKKFFDMFDEEEQEGSVEGGYHLLRLSDHFDLVHEAKAYMKGSDILADEIELATTWTKDDSIHVVNWRDHLAEWAEHQGSWDPVKGEMEDVEVVEEAAETTDIPGDDMGGDSGLAGVNSLSDDETPVKGKVTVVQSRPKDTANLYDGKKHFLLDQNVYYLNRNINIEPNPTVDGYAPTGAAMWGQYLTIEGLAKWRTLDLQQNNMLSIIIPNQQVRLQSFTLTNVLKNHMQNEGDLIFDTMSVDALNWNNLSSGLHVNNAATGDGKDLPNRMTVTGLTDINFTITTEDRNAKAISADIGNGVVVNYAETTKHGELLINHSTAVLQNTDVSTERSGEAERLHESIIRITGVVEHQNITHGGSDNPDEGDEFELDSKELKYQAPEEDEQILPTYNIKKGDPLADNEYVRESFRTNTHLNTTMADAAGKLTVVTNEFKAFRDNSLTMEGGAFNLGTMYKYRLKLRDFAVNGGGVFVEHSTINLNDEVMGGIDARDSATFKGNARADAVAAGKGDTIPASTSGTGDGIIWLKGFAIEDTSEKYIVHVKFVDDGVGDAVKDGMGIADGMEKSGMRIMPDGKYKYNWEVTYNDKEAVNWREDPSHVGIRGMYTFRRRGYTPESQLGPVADLTGSYVSMMQVYNYSFQHSDMFADSVQRAQMDRVYENSYNVVTPVKATKNKNAVAPTPQRATPRPRPCTSKAGLSSALWFNTYASTEQMPLHNGPKVRLDMYGGFIGGDSDLTTHNNGWSSVWSLYGGYMGSTQRYDGVRIRQNGAAIGATGTFYRRNFYTAVTASASVAQATAKGRAGNEDFDLLMGGIASRSGYNFVFDGGRYVLQPNLQVAFTMFNSTDYLNAGGSHISAKPRGVLQVHPFVKFIVNTDCTWKPYGTVGVVCNLLGKTKYRIDGAALPSMSINPYVEYSIGAQYNWSDTTTIFGQITGRNGGRNGAELNAGVRWVW